MNNNVSDLIKAEEKAWYARKADMRRNHVSWLDFYPEYLKTPYKKYISYFERGEKQNPDILELCCGMGEFSFDIECLSHGNVLAVDISEESIDICKQHLKELKRCNLKFEASDIEKIQLPANAFDIICMSGSLSYLNLEIFLGNVKKWLKPEGCLIIVDTYGYSPFFNLKRKLNYLFRRTTKQTLLGIPKEETLNAIKNCFKYTEVNFYGIFAFLGPFLKHIIGDRRTAKVVNFLDRKFSFLKKYAFKFVLIGKNLI